MNRRTLCMMALGLGLLVPSFTFAQDRQGGGGDRGNFDPAQFRERMLNETKERLGATEEEWQVIKPKLEKVTTAQGDAMSSRFGGLFGRGGRGGRGGGEGNGGGERRGGNDSQAQSPARQASRDLSTALENKDTPQDVIAAKLKTLREARTKAKAELETAQKDLQSVLTPRQEAFFVSAGILQGRRLRRPFSMDALLSNLTDRGLLSPDAAERARVALANGSALEEAVLSADGLGEEALLRFLAESFGLPFVEVERRAPSKEFLAAFPARVLVRHHLLPLEEVDGVTLVATSRLSDTTGVDELRLVSGREIALALAPSGEIDRVLKQLLGVGADTLQTLAADSAEIQVLDDDGENDLDDASAAQDASIIRFVNQVMTEAIELRATDVHVEPFEDQLRLRYRIDGILQQAPVPPSFRRFHAAIVSRLKILSHLDIAEKRLPQDGRIKLKIAGREIDVRVSIIPMIHGEAVVLRILDRSDAILGVEHLGMASRDRKHFDKLLEMPHGIVLVTGPTGSGKTTTLYAALSKINDIERKIVTIEDPVEYQLRGVNQIQVNTKSGLTFAMGLRSILRHDPDVVLVGEIRDTETANIAIQASLTGHLVFSTLHTNDAPGAATRLVEMGVEPYLVSSSVEAVIAQRLVRVICKHCKAQVPESDIDVLRAEFGNLLPPVLHKGAGCRQCQGTGYRGRRGIFEMMPMSDEIRGLCLERAPSHLIRKVAVKQGMGSLREDGWRLIHEGLTTIDEVMQNTKDEAASLGEYATAERGAV